MEISSTDRLFRGNFHFDGRICYSRWYDSKRYCKH